VANESSIAEAARPAAFVCPTFEQLYTSARGWLPAELRKLGVLVDVEDLVHDVVIIAHRRLGHFDPSKHRGEHDDPAHVLRVWMRGIAWHRVAKRHEASHRTAALLSRADVAHVTPEEPSAEHVAAAGERRRILLGVLAKMKPRRAEVLMLHALLDMTTPEIARHLGLKENTVKSRIIRGRYDVREAIERLPREQQSALQSLEEAGDLLDCRSPGQASRRARDARPRSPAPSIGASPRTPGGTS
jgi:RNA polymerase sigma-70 factor (ECF subfamily)